MFSRILIRRVNLYKLLLDHSLQILKKHYNMSYLIYRLNMSTIVYSALKSV